MIKKFVPITSNASPSSNPYEVRTYISEQCPRAEWKKETCKIDIRKCVGDPEKSTIAKVMTIEEQLKRLEERAKEIRYNRPYRRWCIRGDYYDMCIATQRTPSELKTHAIARENYIRTNEEMLQRVHEGRMYYEKGEAPSIVQLASPINLSEAEETAEEATESGTEEEKPARVQLASPSCSSDHIYAPTRRVLELKRPRSGYFHNESERPCLEEDGIDYSVYNPRAAQESLESQQLKRYDILEGKTPLDLWTWNIGYQEKSGVLDQVDHNAKVLPFDCDNLELTVYQIPNDLDKTFRGSLVIGSKAIIPTPVRKKKNEAYFNRPPEIASIFIAYVQRFYSLPDYWTTETLDTILDQGEKLLNKSASINYKSSDMDFDIIPQIQEQQAVIGLKLHYSGPMGNEPNIFKTLHLYFSKYDAAILCSDTLFLLIWKRCSKSFFVFDPNGRDDKGVRDLENGTCSLSTVAFVEHLVHLIVNISNLDLSADYKLYEIFLVNYGKILNPIPMKPFPKPFHRLWVTINKYYALIPGFNNGLHPPISQREANASIIIALLGILYSQIELAKTWRPAIIDDLCRFGQDFYKRLTKRLKLKGKQQLNIVDVPEIIMMVAYKARFQKRPFLYNGNIAHCRNFWDSQLSVAVTEFLSSKYEAALLQIDNLFLAIFRDKELYYVFDPFRRGRVGEVLDPEDYMTKGVACLQMHSNIESLCRNLYSKSLLLSNGGKFFLHGIKIHCIKPVAAGSELKNNYPALKIAYPKVIRKPVQKSNANDDEKSVKSLKDEKPASGKKGNKRTPSITSLPFELRLPEYTDEEMVEDLLEELLCEIISVFPEPMFHHGPLYRQGQAVLLRTDKKYLEYLKYGVVHNQDADNIFTRPEECGEPVDAPLTLQEELKLPTNFVRLPDGIWAVFGKNDIPVLEEDTTKSGGLLATLLAAALAAKYRISTWNPELISFAVENVNSFGENLQTYERVLNIILDKTIPLITVGESTYKIEVQRIIQSNITTSLHQMLQNTLMSYNRILVICQRFSTLIIKRYNFLYMFVGFSCTPVGFRRFGTGPGCLIRSTEIDGLIRRIECGCNPSGGEISNYVLIPIRVSEEPYERFKKMLPEDERAVYQFEKDRLTKTRAIKKEKLRFLQDELRKEHERNEKFEGIKRSIEARREDRRMGRGKRRETSDEEEIVTEENTEEEFYEEEEETEVELKHKPGRRLGRELSDEEIPRAPLYGYRMREKDCLYKIQGCFYLSGREEVSQDGIKGCFFASTLAIVHASMRPLHEWCSSRIDRIIDGTNIILKYNSNMMAAQARIIKNVDIEDFTFELWVRSYSPLGIAGLPIEKKLKRCLTYRDFLMLQTPNGTYAIYHDRFYHLFDPYNSMHILDDEKESKEKPKKIQCPRGFRKYAERNSASWVLFAEIRDLMKYVKARTMDKDFDKNGDYQFYVVDVLSLKKAPPKYRLIQMLTELAEAPIEPGEIDETSICVKNETRCWLELENCLPAWSRLNRRNTSGKYRNISLTKYKNFDIEIENRLWSLWGNLHPCAPVFHPESRGKQFLACNIMALTALKLYRLKDWSPQLIDHIIINGDRYHRESLANIQRGDYEFSIEDLNVECSLENVRFQVHVELVCYGCLYVEPTRTRMNLADSLMYFFNSCTSGILQCDKKSLAFGRCLKNGSGYFMFDCMSYGHPLFPKGQGAAYVLYTKHLQVLLYCMIVTLNVPFNAEFTIRKVEMLREGARFETSDEDEGREEAG